MKCKNECRGFYEIIKASDWLSAMSHRTQPIRCMLWCPYKITTLFLHFILAVMLEKY